MATIRQPNVAGLFYPADPSVLREAVHRYLDAAHRDRALPAPKALIAPHAGYPYSGPVAGSAYALLQDSSQKIERVILLGPSHRLPFRGLVSSRADAFLTPLGPVPVDGAAYEAIADLRVRSDEAPFQGEHCLEVQLPFLQETLGSFRILPFLVGDAGTEEVAEVLERLWDGPDTLIVVSSDLSHYLDADQARRLDRKTTQAIESLQPEKLGYEQACGRNPIRGLLQVARRRGLRVRTLDLRNSGDTAGPPNRVVGYGAYAFFAS